MSIAATAASHAAHRTVQIISPCTSKRVWTRLPCAPVYKPSPSRSSSHPSRLSRARSYKWSRSTGGRTSLRGASHLSALAFSRRSTQRALRASGSGSRSSSPPPSASLCVFSLLLRSVTSPQTDMLTWDSKTVHRDDLPDACATPRRAHRVCARLLLLRPHVRPDMGRHYRLHCPSEPPRPHAPRRVCSPVPIGRADRVRGNPCDRRPQGATADRGAQGVRRELEDGLAGDGRNEWSRAAVGRANARGADAASDGRNVWAGGQVTRRSAGLREGRRHDRATGSYRCGNVNLDLLVMPPYDT